MLISIGVQSWRMYSQFEIIQSQLVSDIQSSLDTALDEYYAEIAKDDVFTLTDNLQEFEWSEEMKSGPDTIVSKFFFQKSLVDSIGSRDSIPDSEDFFERVGKS